MTLLARLLVLVALAATVAACGDESPSARATTGDRGWERVVPGGDCRCSDGSEFSFWVRKANPKKVVFYLQDGGACFSAKTCAPENDLYQTRVDEGPTAESGIFDLADERNPFADYSFVFVPYCTADVHIGNATRKYAPGLTVRHKGYVNGTAALDRLAAAFPGATDVVVIGESAGSIAAPLYAGLAADRLPEARITVLADGSGAYPGGPRFNEITAAWGPTAKGSFAGHFIRSGRRDPKIVFARHDYAYDEEQASRLSLVGLPAEDLLARIDANERRIERAGVNLLSYIAPGNEHTVLSDGPFYTERVNGQRFVDWVTRLIERKPVDDVHCKACTAR